ncbi:hypothetical protein FQZ97_1215680 [compost metagenome]
MVGVDQLVVDRWSIGQQPEPAERIDALVLAQHASRNALARDAVEAVATGDVVAVDALQLAILLVGDVRLLALQFVQLDVLR